MGGVVEVEDSRLAAVETDVKHLSKDVGEIKVELKSVAEINKSVGESLATLTLLSEQAKGRDEKLIPRIEKLEAWQSKKDGIIIVLVSVFTMFGDNISKALGL